MTARTEEYARLAAQGGSDRHVLVDGRHAPIGHATQHRQPARTDDTLRRGRVPHR